MVRMVILCFSIMVGLSTRLLNAETSEIYKVLLSGKSYLVKEMGNMDRNISGIVLMASIVGVVYLVIKYNKSLAKIYGILLGAMLLLGVGLSAIFGSFGFVGDFKDIFAAVALCFGMMSICIFLSPVETTEKTNK